MGHLGPKARHAFRTNAGANRRNEPLSKKSRRRAGRGGSDDLYHAHSYYGQ